MANFDEEGSTNRDAIVQGWLKVHQEETKHWNGRLGFGRGSRRWFGISDWNRSSCQLFQTWKLFWKFCRLSDFSIFRSLCFQIFDFSIIRCSIFSCLDFSDFRFLDFWISRLLHFLICRFFDYSCSQFFDFLIRYFSFAIFQFFDFLISRFFNSPIFQFLDFRQIGFTIF